MITLQQGSLKEGSTTMIMNNYAKWAKNAQQILDEVNGLDKSCGSYEKKLALAFSKYQMFVSKDYTQVENGVCVLCRMLKRVVKYYLEGNIQGAFASFSSFWNDSHSKDGIEQGFQAKYACDYLIKGEKHLYRLRNMHGKVRQMKKEEMFHVPFSERGKAANYRYSIAGYPCLYCGLSIFTCWMEMRCPHVTDMYYTAFKVRENCKLRLLDMRIPVSAKDGDVQEPVKHIVMFPLVLACSIKVHADKENDAFKEEYIIPQVLLHTLLKGKVSNKNGYDGCIYTSTQRNEDFPFLKVENINDNIVLFPHGDHREDYSSGLLSKLKMCQPSSFDLMLIRHGFNLDKGSKGTDYSKSLFGRIEHQLNNSDFGDIL